MTGTSISDLLTAAKMRLMLKAEYAFFGAMLGRLPIRVVEDPCIGRDRDPVVFAFTDGRKIVIGEKLLYQHDLDAVVFVLLHEIAHVAFLHFARIGDRNPKLWNIAADLAIHSWLLTLFPGAEEIVKKLNGCLPGHGQFQQFPLGKSAEWYYEELVSQGWQAGALSVSFGEVGPAESDEDGAAGLSDQLVDEIRTAVAAAVAAHKHRNSGRGLDSSPLDALLQVLFPVDPIDWTVLLRRVVHRLVERSTSRRQWKFNRRWQQVQRRLRKDFAPDSIVVAIDVSGSMTKDAVARALGRCAEIRRYFPVDLVVLCHDTEVLDRRVIPAHRPVPKVWDFKLGGGTSHRALWEAIRKWENPSVVVAITDGYTDWAEDVWPRVPVILVVPAGQEQLPKKAAAVVKVSPENYGEDSAQQ